MITKEKQKVNRDRKEALIKVAKESGVIDRVARLMSAMFLLHSEVGVILDDINDVLEENGLKVGGLIGTANKLDRALDDYFKAFNKILLKGQNVAWAEDLSKFDEMFRKFADI